MMKRTKRRTGFDARQGVLALVAVLLAASPVTGQQGHPLAGSWHGEWGQAPDRIDLTVIINWDGQNLTGLVNPVTDRAALENAILDSESWTVRFEVDVKGPSNELLHCLADGRLEQLGSDRRRLSGSWHCGDIETDFEIIRDRDY